MYKFNGACWSLIRLLFILIALSSSAFAGQAILTWDAPTTNANGTSLTDLAAYKIYYSTTPVTTQLLTGCSSGFLVPSTTSSPTVGTTVTATVPLPDPATPTTYYFAVTVCDASGNESEFSNEVSKTISETNHTSSGGCGIIFPKDEEPPGPGQMADMLAIAGMILLVLIRKGLRAYRLAGLPSRTLVCNLVFISLLFISGCGGGGSESTGLVLPNPDQGGSVGSGQGMVTLNWEAPTTNVDETQLTDPTGYHIYYATTSVISQPLTGCTSGFLVPSATPSPTPGTTVTATVSIPDPATPTTYYFAITVCDASGNESAFSNEVSKTISPPVNTTPPPVSSTTPADNATGGAVNSSTSVTFNEPMDTSLITIATFTITPQEMKRG